MDKARVLALSDFYGDAGGTPQAEAKGVPGSSRAEAQVIPSCLPA